MSSPHDSAGFRSSPSVPPPPGSPSALNSRDRHSFDQSRRALFGAGGGPPPATPQAKGLLDPFLIGVAGGTASGKTTVCDMIMHQLQERRVVLISQDSFYRGLTPEELKNVKDYNFDHPNAMDQQAIMQCLTDLKQRKAVQVPIYDFKTHSRSVQTTTVQPGDVIIFEGILTLAMDEVRALCNMKIFVDTDDDVRLARRIKRDTIDRGRDVNGVIEQYTKFVKPMFDAYVSPSKKHADVIIPWAHGDNTVAIDLIVQHIRSKIGQDDLRRIYQNLKVLPPNFQIRGMHTIIRDRMTGRNDFVFYADRRGEILGSAPALIRLVVEHGLGYLPFLNTAVVTPTGEEYAGVTFANKLCGVSVIRSGESMENALRACCKGIKIGKILIQRENQDQRQPCKIIYEKLPSDISTRYVLFLDPILASGSSAIAALEVLLAKGVKEENIIFLSIIAAPQGIHRVCTAFPKIQVVTSEIDHTLSEKHIVLPGIGEFGDRYFGTEQVSATTRLTEDEPPV